MKISRKPCAGKTNRAGGSAASLPQKPRPMVIKEGGDKRKGLEGIFDKANPAGAFRWTWGGGQIGLVKGQQAVPKLEPCRIKENAGTACTHRPVQGNSPVIGAGIRCQPGSSKRTLAR